ncbi:hypothetical protein ACE2AJ_15850 [Aquihabitans daechungensis]|uniref:hypothetical protein n=1 Tax=Aquihabitans daechungensis TaxID=1052257 RepID=UPI003B9F9858
MPSTLVFCVVLGVMAIAAAALWSDVGNVLPDVGKDKQGEDPWNDPVGIEKVAGFQVARIPDCAAAPVVRIGLWDEASQPYWEVSGPPTPMASFAIGATPEGFTENKAFTKPPAGAVLRLVVFRKVKGVAGVRYQESDLRTGYVASGQPISRYGVEDFQTGDVCGDDGEGDGSTTTTTGLVATTTTTALTGG